MAKLLVTGALALALAALWGCTTTAAPASAAASPAHYRCEHDIEFTVRFVDDSAMLDAGPRGSDVLLRDAGGATPQQTVYSNPRMRAEFGLGVSGREAIVRYPLLPLAAHCVQD